MLRELQAIYETDPSQRWAWQLRRLLRLAWQLVKSAKETGRTQLPAAQRDRILALFDQLLDRANQQVPHNHRQPGQRGRVAQSVPRNLIDRIY